MTPQIDVPEDTLEDDGPTQIELWMGEWKDSIDAKLVPLIREVWKAGIGTNFTFCDTNGGSAWIAFTSAAGAERFLNIVAGEPTDDASALYHRVRQGGDLNEHVPGTWSYGLLPADSNGWPSGTPRDPVPGLPDGAAAFYLMINIWLPTVDVPVLIQRMEDYNNNTPAQHAA